MNNPLRFSSLERKVVMGEEITERYYVRRREFLNEYSELPAFIIGIVEDTRWLADDDADQRWNNGEIMLVLADCYRRVNFEFSMYDAADRAHTLRKISLIAEVVNAVRDAIALEVESRNARPVKTQPSTTEPDSHAAEVLEVTSRDAQWVTTEPAETEAVPRAQVFTSHIITLGL
jgi:hypothetical protein